MDVPKRWLCLLLLALATAVRAEVVEVAAQPDGSVVARSTTYEATVRPDGWLHSLKVRGTELLDDHIDVSRGAYFYAAPRGVLELGRPQVAGTEVTAEGEPGKLTYRFRLDGVDLTADSRVAGTWYWVCSRAVTQVRDETTHRELPVPASLDTTDVTLLTDGPWVRLTGGDRAWGPWPSAQDGRQLCQRTLAPGQSYALHLTVGGDGALPKPDTQPAQAVAGAALTPLADGGAQVKGETYEARLAPDGYLHSLKVGGVELLDDSVGISRGTYLFTNQAIDVGKLTVDGNQATANGDAGRIRYTFAADRLLIDLDPKVTGHWFAVLSKAVTRVKDNATGQEADVPAKLTSGDVTFRAGLGPWVQMIGGASVWGPFEGRQVFDRPVQAGQHYSLAMVTGGKASPANLIGLDVSSTDADYLTPAGVPMPFLVRVGDGSELPFDAKVTLSYLDYTSHQELARQDIPLHVGAGGSAGTVVQVGRDQPGWYDLRFQLGGTIGPEQVSATRELTIGVDPEKVAPERYAPADLQAFWDRTRAGLAAKPINAQLTPMPQLSTGRSAVYKLRFDALTAEPVYAWFVHPKAAGRHPGILVVPGYGDHGIGNPSYLADQGYCAVAIQVRHHDVDLPKYEGGPYMTVGIDSPDTYVYRDIYAQCLRAVDFLASRDEVGPDRLMVMGMSQGGGLSLAAAALDPRLKLSAPEVPFLSDYPEAFKVAGSPYAEIAGYLQQHPDRRDAVMHTLSYFDTLNLAPLIRCPVVMTVGLRDRTCPPPTVFAVYHQLTVPKQLFVYPPMGHAVSPEFATQRAKWMQALLPGM